jgi:hypothetical protein
MIPFSVKVRSPGGGGIIAPGVETAIGATGGFLPLGFRWQTFFGPGTIGLGIIPSRLDDWQLLDAFDGLQDPAAKGIGRRTVASRLDKSHVPFIGHLDLINLKCVEIDRSLGPFVWTTLSFRTPHQKFTSWDGHHWYRIWFLQRRRDVRDGSVPCLHCQHYQGEASQFDDEMT